jgi:hypothetical protein
MSAKQRLDELQTAENEWYAKEKTRLEAEYNFLDAISKKRRGNAALQDLNADGASAILVDSINDYLGKPL